MAEMKHYCFTRIAASILCAVFLWTFGGFFDIAYAFKKSSQRSAFSDQHSKKEKTAAQKFQEVLVEMEEVVNESELLACVKSEKLKEKEGEIDALDSEVKRQFAETEQKLMDRGAPRKILSRHRDFVSNYESDLNILKSNIAAIGKAKTRKELDKAVEAAKEHFEKNRAPEKHKPVDPALLPHRSVEPGFKEPRTKPGQFLADGGAGLPACPDFGCTGKGEILLASNGPLEGLLSAEVQKSRSAKVTDFPAFPSHSLNTYELSDSRSNDASDPLDYILLAQTLNPPTADDLSETIEVRFTPSITDKAAELEHHPLKIYEWVRNNINFIPTYGSVQGAGMCLETKKCNAFDTASLLIALLRESGIPSRYVEGTVELSVEKVMNWVGGFADANAALNLIASGGIPVTGLTSGGEIVMVRMEHAWVEAYVDYIPYRGAVPGEGDTWIPMDASYKQYEFMDGLDADSAVPTNFEALVDEAMSQSTTDNDIPSITGISEETVQSQVSDFQARLQDYMSAHIPEADNYYDLRNSLHGDKEIIPRHMRFLPASLEGMKVVARLGGFSEVPQRLKHRVNFSVGGFMDDEPLTYGISLPEIAGKRVTLSYVPATSDDAQVMADAEGILNVPLYLVEVVPELKIEGHTVVSGHSVVMGNDQELQMSFTSPGGKVERVTSTVQAGEYHAVGINSNEINFQHLYDRVNAWQPDSAIARDDRLGELLHLTSMFYFARSDYFINEMAQSIGIVSVRQPSVCNVSIRLKLIISSAPL
jgi:hypothetical protein